MAWARCTSFQRRLTAPQIRCHLSVQQSQGNMRTAVGQAVRAAMRSQSVQQDVVDRRAVRVILLRQIPEGLEICRPSLDEGIDIDVNPEILEVTDLPALARQ